ncbi:aminotransferase class V-fold PLP-dependent enzyme [Candidatus Saccharibacteria bacterium]|nr:aminotransferase class V-fold PLP-dependent enzyme [Candidatus Saccharibacteria bacterium]
MENMNDFDYLKNGEVYLDSACQSLRPRPVLDALCDYYEKFNSCGERVKYPWGVETDKKVEATREKVLKYLKLKTKDYFVSFTLNTTYGINLILSQLDSRYFNAVITTDIEHNSPFLSTMAFAKRCGIPRKIISRNADGSVPLEEDFSKAVVVLNAASNIDGRKLVNIRELTDKVHQEGGIIIIDAAQAMAHSAEVLYKTEVDAICFSAHKMYAPSLGGIIARKNLLEKLETSFIGGGMVDDVDKESYLLSSEKNPDRLYTKFESGLQAWGEIIALGEAIDWLEKRSKKDCENLKNNYTELFEFLNDSNKVHMINQEANPTMSFYVEGIDSHLLGEALGAEKIMVRTGYFCAHYYLDKVKKYPPLVRFSLGYHNRPEDIEKVKRVMGKIV